MKRIISLFSLLTASIIASFFFLTSNKQPLRAQGPNKQSTLLEQAIDHMSPDTMPAEMFKDYVIDLLEHEDPKVFDLLTPLMLMATKQHDLARKILRHETIVTDEQLLILRSNSATSELALMIDVVAQGRTVATACKKLLSAVKKLEIIQTTIEEINHDQL